MKFVPILLLLLLLLLLFRPPPALSQAVRQCSDITADDCAMCTSYTTWPPPSYRCLYCPFSGACVLSKSSCDPPNSFVGNGCCPPKRGIDGKVIETNVTNDCSCYSGIFGSSCSGDNGCFKDKCTKCLSNPNCMLLLPAKNKTGPITCADSRTTSCSGGSCKSWGLVARPSDKDKCSDARGDDVTVLTLCNARKDCLSCVASIGCGWCRSDAKCYAWSYPNFKGSCLSEIDLSRTTCPPKADSPSAVIKDAAAACAAAAAAAKDVQAAAASFGTVVNVMAMIIAATAGALQFLQHRRVRRMINEQHERAIQMKRKFESSASGLSEKSREKYRRRIKAASSEQNRHLGRQWLMYTPYLFISAASVSFGFVMWSITAAAAAAAADGSAAADQSLVGQLPPSQDVSLRDDVKIWHSFASATSILAGAFIALRLYEVAIAAGYYQIKIPGVTPDRIKLGTVKPKTYDDDFGMVLNPDGRQSELKLARLYIILFSSVMSAAHFVGCIQFPAALLQARFRFQTLMKQVEAKMLESDEGRLTYEEMTQMYSSFNSGQTVEAYLSPLMFLLVPLLMMLLMYFVLIHKSLSPLKVLVYDKLRKHAADTAHHRNENVDPEERAKNTNARKKYFAIRGMVIKLFVVVVFQIVVIVYKTAGMAGMALALILPVSSDCGMCGECQSLLYLNGMTLQLQPAWAILYHTMSLPVSVTLGIWGLQRSNRLAPAVLIVAATATIARIRSAFRRRVRRSKANGVLRYMTRCFRYIRRGAGAAAGKMKKGRVFPSDATSIQISPSMKG